MPRKTPSFVSASPVKRGSTRRARFGSDHRERRRRDAHGHRGPVEQDHAAQRLAVASAEAISRSDFQLPGGRRRHPRGGLRGRPPPPMQVRRRRTGRHVRPQACAPLQRDAERPRREGPRAVLPPIASAAAPSRATIGRTYAALYCQLWVAGCAATYALVSWSLVGLEKDWLQFQVARRRRWGRVEPEVGAYLPEPGRARVREGVAGGDDVQGDWLEDREIRRPVETVHEMALKSRAFSRLVLISLRWQKNIFQRTLQH